MTTTSWTLIWVALPFISGFVIYLLPKIDRYLTIITLVLTSIYPCWLLLSNANFNIPLKDNFGVSLMIDNLSGYLILTNCLVTIAVTFIVGKSKRKLFFMLS